MVSTFSFLRSKYAKILISPMRATSCYLVSLIRHNLHVYIYSLRLCSAEWFLMMNITQLQIKLEGEAILRFSSVANSKIEPGTSQERYIYLSLFSPAMKYWQVILYTRPTVDLRQGWPVFFTSVFQRGTLLLLPPTPLYTKAKVHCRHFLGRAGKIYFFIVIWMIWAPSFFTDTFPVNGFPFWPSVRQLEATL